MFGLGTPGENRSAAGPFRLKKRTLFCPGQLKTILKSERLRK